MQAMRGKLTPEAGGDALDVEGELDSPEDQSEIIGQFEVQDSPELMQDVMDGKSFQLAVDGAATLTIKITTISTTDKPGTSLAIFKTI
jgi:hypothetical protein